MESTNDNNNNNNNSDSPKKSKILEFNLKSKKLKENNTNKYFDKITDVLISFNLLPFLNKNEVKNCGCLNTKFYNAFIRFCENRFYSIKDLYNIKNENQYINLNELYEQKDDKGHYIKLGIFTVEHYSLFGENNWTWKEDKRYWNKVAAKNSILNKEIYSLDQVCWVDVNQTITHVFNGKYNLYLNHCVCNLAQTILKLTVYLDDIAIYETQYPSQELKDNCIKRHSKKEEDQKDDNKGNRGFNRGILGFRRFGPMRYQKVELKEKKVDKDLITEIDVPFDEKLDKNEGHKITVKFDHTEGSWKHGWMIDGFILEKI